MMTALPRALVFIAASIMLAACAGGGGTRSSVPPSGQDYRQGGRIRITPQSVCSTGPSVNPCGSTGPCGIYSSTAFETPFATDDRTIVGVGEAVNMSTDYGKAWHVVGNGSVSPRIGSSTVFTAGSTGGSATVIVSGFKPACDSQSIIFTVVTPSVGYYNNGRYLHHQDIADVGFGSDLYEAPNTVNFYNTYVQEAQATVTATGVWACQNGVIHEPNGPVPVQAGVYVYFQGTLINATDTSYSGSCSGVQNQDGSEALAIPMQYAVGGPGPWYNTNTVNVSATATAAGNLTRSKDHASWSTTLYSPTVGY